MDLIDRQAAIDVIDSYDVDAPDYMQGWAVKLIEAIKGDIRGLISELPSAQPEQRWIPCSERPPEEERYVLIIKEPFKINGCEQEVIKAKRSADPRSGKIEWWSPEFGTLTNKAVLAWMPLPESYKGE